MISCSSLFAGMKLGCVTEKEGRRAKGIPGISRGLGRNRDSVSARLPGT